MIQLIYSWYTAAYRVPSTKRTRKSRSTTSCAETKVGGDGAKLASGKEEKLTRWHWHAHANKLQLAIGQSIQEAWKSWNWRTSLNWPGMRMGHQEWISPISIQKRSFFRFFLIPFACLTLAKGLGAAFRASFSSLDQNASHILKFSQNNLRFWLRARWYSIWIPLRLGF